MKNSRRFVTIIEGAMQELVGEIMTSEDGIIQKSEEGKTKIFISGRVLLFNENSFRESTKEEITNYFLKDATFKSIVQKENGYEMMFDNGFKLINYGGELSMVGPVVRFNENCVIF